MRTSHLRPSALEECNQAIHRCAQSSDWKQAIALLGRLEGKADRISFNSAINACSKAAQWQRALGLLSQLKGRSIQTDHISYNTCMDACARSSHWAEAVCFLRRTLDAILSQRQYLFGLNTGLSAVARAAKWRVALPLLEQIRSQFLEANEVTLKWWQSACNEHWKVAIAGINMLTDLGLTSPWLPPFSMAETSRWPSVLRLLHQMKSSSQQVDAVSLSSIASTLADWRCSLSMLRAFLRKEALVTTAVVKAFSQGSQWPRGVAYLQTTEVDAYTVSAAILGCGGSSWPSAVLLLDEADAYKVQLNVVVYGAALSVCEQSGQLAMAMHLFNDMCQKELEANLVIYNTIISSCAVAGAWLKASEFLEDMERCHQAADVVTCSSLMHGCVLGSVWPLALQLLGQFAGRSLQPSAVTFGTAISACEAGGCWQLAVHLLEEQGRRQLRVSNIELNSAISACEKGLAWQEGLDLLRQLPSHSLKADFVTYSASIRLCERSGHWTRALAFLELMRAAQMVPAVVATMDAACAAAAAAKPDIAKALAQEMSDPVDKLWCLAQIFCCDPQLIREALRAMPSALAERETEVLLRVCSSLSLLGIECKEVSVKVNQHLMSLMPCMSLQQLNVAATAAAKGRSLEILQRIQDWCFERLKTAEGTFEEDADSLLGVLWVTRQLQCTSRRMLRTSCAWILLGAARLDRAQGMLRPTLFAAGAGTTNGPAVLRDLVDRAVLLKPPGWDVYDESVEDKQLCRFAREALGAWPIFLDRRHRRGFLHRLDVPSSGLVVVAKTYKSYYDLQVQLSTEMARKYVVMAHGWLSPRAIEASVFWWDNGPTAAGGRGKFSRSNVLASQRLLGGGSSFSLLRMEILTGRKHQIRSHLSHCGHPTVSDGLYAATNVYISDCNFCPRNWLHRYGLAFKDCHGQVIRLQSPVPADLKEAMKQMTVVKTCQLDVDAWLKEGEAEEEAT
eukprot:s929_g16.t1